MAARLRPEFQIFPPSTCPQPPCLPEQGQPGLCLISLQSCVAVQSNSPPERAARRELTTFKDIEAAPCVRGLSVAHPAFSHFERRYGACNHGCSPNAMPSAPSTNWASPIRANRLADVTIWRRPPLRSAIRAFRRLSIRVRSRARPSFALPPFRQPSRSGSRNTPPGQRSSTDGGWRDSRR